MTGTAAPLPTDLPDFPAADRPLETPAPLTGRGLRLRRACRADLPWLIRLYATTRAQEMAQVPWPEAMRQAFLREQFALQHRHYLKHYGDSDFLILEGPQGAVGRYYLQPTGPDHLLVDISLWPEQRNQGIGKALIRASQQQAQRQGCGMQLHVTAYNAGARRLYERLGFVVTGTQNAYHHMRWVPPGECAA